MSNKSYLHVFGVVSVVVFAVVLALSVGAVFFAGNQTAYAFDGADLKTLDIPVSMLKYYNGSAVTNVGGNQLLITAGTGSTQDSIYYFIYFDDIRSAFSDVLFPSANALFYKVNGSSNTVGSGTIYMYGSLSYSTNSWSRSSLPVSGSFVNKDLWGLNLKFNLMCSDVATSTNSTVDITSITLYYYDNDPLFDYAYDTGFEEGRDLGYDAGYDAGYDSGYSDGEDDGWRVGYDEGFADGEATGYNEGYDEGFADGEDSGYSEGYERGFDSGVLEGLSDGYEQGFNEGKEVGRQEGYDVGYSDGVKTAEDLLNWSNSVVLDISAVSPYVDEVDNMHGYNVTNGVLPSTGQPAIQVSRTAPPMLPACQISLGSSVPAETVIEFRWEALEPRGLASSGSYINFGALDQYGVYHYLVSSSTDSNNLGFTVSLPVDTLYIVVSTSQSVEYMYLVGVSYRIAGRTAYDIGLNVGYETGYLDGKGSIPVDDIKSTAYYEGFDDGVQSANEYTFTGLIGAAIDAPIKAFRGLFGFDVLGTNLANLALSLFTLSIILVVVKFVIKSS